MDPTLPETLENDLWLYMAPVIFAAGLFGNVILIIITATSNRKGSDIAFFIRNLAIADLLVIVLCMPPAFLRAANVIDFEEIHEWSCKFAKFFEYTSMDYAIWVISAYSVERAIAVCLPFKKRTVCSIGKARKYVILLLFLAIAKNFHHFWTRGTEIQIVNGTELFVRNCGYPKESDRYFTFHIRPWIVFIFSNVVPMVFIVVSNCAVLWALHRQNNNLTSHGEGQSRSQSTSHVTVICLVVSLAFFICITPGIVLYVGRSYWTADETSMSNYIYSICKAINDQFIYINHSINFYISILSSASFRKLSVQVLCCTRRKGPATSQSHSKGMNTNGFVSKALPRPSFTMHTGANGVTDLNADVNHM